MKKKNKIENHKTDHYIDWLGSFVHSNMKINGMRLLTEIDEKTFFAQAIERSIWACEQTVCE